MGLVFDVPKELSWLLLMPHMTLLERQMLLLLLLLRRRLHYDGILPPVVRLQLTTPDAGCENDDYEEDGDFYEPNAKTSSAAVLEENSYNISAACGTIHNHPLVNNPHARSGMLAPHTFSGSIETHGTEPCPPKTQEIHTTVADNSQEPNTRPRKLRNRDRPT